MSFSIAANLIRQWCYCPRVMYYQEMTNLTIARPIWVKQGAEFHIAEQKLWQRRNLSRFSLQQGKKYYDLAMQDEQYSLHGIADMIIETETAVYPIEFKLSASGKKRGDILQLTAYAILAESHFGKPAETGFLVGKGKVLHIIQIDEKQRQATLEAAEAIRTILRRGQKPESSATVAQCCACEYVNFCNDRL